MDKISEIEELLNELLNYGIDNLALDDYELYFRLNKLRNLFSLQNFKFIRKKNSAELPDGILERITNHAQNNGIEMLSDDHFKDELMGLVSPSNETVVNKFFSFKKLQDRTDYLFNFGIKNYYIRKSSLAKNIFFQNEKVEALINLSRPEKSNKETAELLKAKAVDYPKCMLCLENLGYEGRINYPARNTIRIIPLTLNKEKWFMQYSPYAYFKEHAIIINEKHTNMQINENTFLKMLDFTKNFPHYFVGSNACLPIIGGSILNHEHYQAGNYLTPLRKSLGKRLLLEHDDLRVYEIDWPIRSIRVKSRDLSKIAKFCAAVNEAWENHTDLAVNILSNSNGIKHNALTPFCYKENEEYIFDLLFRNNRATEENPDGIFHVEKKYQNIKKEALGLLEVSGYFVLPGRLKIELEELAELLMQGKNLLEENPLYKHWCFFKETKEKFGNCKSVEELFEGMKKVILSSLERMLPAASCFKMNEEGEKAFERFIEKIKREAELI